MAAIFFQLISFVLLLITVQILATADDLQEYEDYEESDDASSRKFTDYLKNELNLQPQFSNSRSSINNFQIDSLGSQEYEGEIYDDRQTRSFGHQIYEGRESFCIAVKRQTPLSDDNFQYIPSFLNEKICQPVGELLDPYQKGMCYVRGNNCQTVTREITVFKRRKHAAHCWSFEIRNISDGCRCYFDQHHLGIKSYIG